MSQRHTVYNMTLNVTNKWFQLVGTVSNLYARKDFFYWYQKQQQQVIIFPSDTIVHQFLDFVTVKYVHGIIRIIRNRSQEKKDLQRHHICLTDSDQNYILE